MTHRPSYITSHDTYRYSRSLLPNHNIYLSEHIFIQPSISATLIERSITPPILPTRTPPLLPKPTIKLLLPQFPIHLVMRPTHPIPEFLTSTQPRLIRPAWLRHPIPEVIRAYPAWIQARENSQERPHLGLLFVGGPHWVRSCEGMKEGPG